MMEYVAKFTELACFTDDYVATDMAKVRRFWEAPKSGGSLFFFLLNEQCP